MSETNRAGLPPLYVCDICGCALRPDQPGVWRRVNGWVQNRKSGGANHIAFPEPEPGLLCNTCMDYKKLRPSLDQDSLF